MSAIYLIGTIMEVKATMSTIYLIGTHTGAARTSQEHMARNIEQICHYHRCTREEYLRRMREMRAHDLPPAPTENDRTASSTASSTPAGTPATLPAGRQQVRQQKDAV